MKQAAGVQFDSWADSYDRLILNRFLFHPSYRAFIEELVRWQGQSGRRQFDLLDVGCGTGSLALMVAGAGLGGRVVGLDYAEKMCRLADGKANGARLNGGVKFVRADSEHLPFASAGFDVVTCSNSFHHYPHQVDVLSEMRRVLRPGGRLMLIDGFRDNVIGWFVFDVCANAMEGGVKHASWLAVRRMFEQSDFVDITQRKFNFWLPVLLTVGSVPG